ncbi:HET-domain-containing protein [Polyplosphaeria fusca]|uniref:HET-domain-containing protein n=1 Tax=Polyplosphaeria fusca TaxID=682080 RepID=A0A9P4V0I1_9PLEO|nr:HET-domain-containing protein [Polyplosphaeria fusca]
MDPQRPSNLYRYFTTSKGSSFGSLSKESSSSSSQSTAATSFSGAPSQSFKRSRELSDEDEPDGGRKRIKRDGNKTLHDNPAFTTYSPWNTRPKASESLCDVCRAIDIEQVFTMPDLAAMTQKGGGVIVRHLQSHDVFSIDCDLCQILLRIKRARIGKQKLHWCMVAYSAVRMFVANEVQQDSVILTMQPYEERLPSRVWRFLISTEQDQDTFHGRKLGERIDWTVVKQWIEFCNRHHSQHCRKFYVLQLPGFKVIDCTNRQIVDVENLLRPTQTHKAFEYVTLSYVWGLNNSKTPVQKALPEVLPATIEDAVTACNSLGFRYLWIDRYCVPQNDDEADRELKQMLIQNMGLIYENSALTLIAVAGENPDCGLPGVRPSVQRLQPSVRIGKRSFVLVNTDFKEDLDNSIWNKRGWPFQEAVLARRRLLFTERGLYFQCRSMNGFEELHMPFDAVHTSERQGNRPNAKIWRLFPSQGVGKAPTDILGLISKYSSKKFSDEKDAYSAFLGILKGFERMNVKNLYGLPLFQPAAFCFHLQNATQRLIYGLSWFTSGCRIGSEGRRRDHPSWTWVGWKAENGASYKYLDDLVPAPNAPKWTPDRFPQHHVRVEYEDGEHEDWERSLNSVTSLSHRSRPPAILWITGPLVDVTIDRWDMDFPVRIGTVEYRRIHQSTEVERWRSYMQLQQNYAIRQHVSLKGLVLYYGSPHGDGVGNLLLLAEVKTAVYERVGVTRVGRSEITRSSFEELVESGEIEVINATVKIR